MLLEYSSKCKYEYHYMVIRNSIGFLSFMNNNCNNIHVLSSCPMVTQMVKHLPAMRETRVWSLSWEDPLEKEWQPSPVFLPGESHGQRGLVGYSPWCHKELAITEWLTHSCYIIDILLKTLHKLLHLTFFLLCGNCHFTNKNLKFKELK